MKIKSTSEKGSIVVNAFFEILDEYFDGAISRKLKQTTFYLIGGNEGPVVKEVMDHLKAEKMDHFMQVFTDPGFKNKKEIVFGVFDAVSGELKSIVAKIRVFRGKKNGEGYSDVSTRYLFEKLLSIFQTKDIVPKKLTKNEERLLVGYIEHEIPWRIKWKSEIVRLENKPVPAYYT